MSQPNNNNNNNNNNKRSVHTTTTATSVDGHFPTMKKAKSQAVASSLDSKNGLQHQQNRHINFEAATADDPMIEDPNNSDDGAATVFGRVAANLSRKKATPPQPTKKLVIKLVKGSFDVSISLFSSFDNVFLGLVYVKIRYLFDPLDLFV